MADAGGLWLSLGLDISKLQAGIDAAQAEIKNGLDKLQKMQDEVRLGTNIDTSAAVSALDKLKVRYSGLAKEAEIARQKETLLRQAFEMTRQTVGVSSQAYQKQYIELLKQQEEVLRLDGRMQNLKSTLQSVTAAGESAVSKGMGSIMDQYAGKLSASAIAGGLALLTKQAAESGEKISDMAKALKISANEAEHLQGLLSLSGVSNENITSFLSGIRDAGAEGNEATRALEKFGAILTTTDGRLVDTKTLLSEIANAYRVAQTLGQEDSFLKSIGATSEEMKKLIENFDDLEGINQRITRSGFLNPEEAVQMQRNMRELNLQTEELKNTIGGALMPAVNQIVPAVKESFATMTRGLASSKEEALSLSSALGSLIASAMKVNDVLFSPMRGLTLKGMMAEYTNPVSEAAKAGGLSQNETMQRAADTQKRMAQETATQVEEIWRRENASQLERALMDIDRRAREEIFSAKATEEEKTRILARAQAERGVILQKAAREMNDIEKGLTDKYINLTGSPLEIELNRIQRDAEKMQENLMKKFGHIPDSLEDLIDTNRITAANKAVNDAIKKTMTSDKEFLEAFRQEIGNVPRLGRGEDGTERLQEGAALEEALQRVEARFRGMILEKQGIDPNSRVTPWELTTMQSLLQNAKNTAGLGLMVGGTPQDMIGALTQATQQFAPQLQAAMDSIISPTMGAMTDAMNMRLSPALEQVSTGNEAFHSQALMYYESLDAKLESILRRVEKREGGLPSVTVQIENAVTEDSASMTKLADNIADRINEVVGRYIGNAAGMTNSY